jgi:hypothetical protein
MLLTLIQPSTPARLSSTITDENAEPPNAGKSPVASVKKSADHMVVGLWTSAATVSVFCVCVS